VHEVAAEKNTLGEPIINTPMSPERLADYLKLQVACRHSEKEILGLLLQETWFTSELEGFQVAQACMSVPASAPTPYVAESPSKRIRYKQHSATGSTKTPEAAEISPSKFAVTKYGIMEVGTSSSSSSGAVLGDGTAVGFSEPTPSQSGDAKKKSLGLQRWTLPWGHEPLPK
jgi:hypothetical protein